MLCGSVGNSPPSPPAFVQTLIFRHAPAPDLWPHLGCLWRLQVEAASRCPMAVQTKCLVTVDVL